MKDRQFRLLIIIIIAQTFFFYYKFHQAQVYNQKVYNEIIQNAFDITHIKETTDQTLEITAKTANGIY